MALSATDEAEARAAEQTTNRSSWFKVLRFQAQQRDSGRLFPVLFIHLYLVFIPLCDYADISTKGGKAWTIRHNWTLLTQPERTEALAQYEDRFTTLELNLLFNSEDCETAETPH